MHFFSSWSAIVVFVLHIVFGITIPYKALANSPHVDTGREHESTNSVNVESDGSLTSLGIVSSDPENLEQFVNQLESRLSTEINSNGSPEKHIPRIDIIDSLVNVVVPHVMDFQTPHWIELIWIKDVKTSRILAVKSFKKTDTSPPILTAQLDTGITIKPLAYCNLHGLWEGDPISI